MRDRLFGPWGLSNAETGEFDLNVGDLVRRLLLFDQLVLHTVRMKELPALVAAFGYDGVLELLNSGIVKVCADAFVLVNIGQTGLASHEAEGGLPLGSYSFASIVPDDSKAYVSSCFSEVEPLLQVDHRKFLKLKHAVADRLTPPLVERNTALRGLESDVGTNATVVGRAVARVLAERLGQSLSADDLELRVERLDEAVFRVESDWARDSTFRRWRSTASSNVDYWALGASMSASSRCARSTRSAAWRKPSAGCSRPSSAFLAEQFEPGAQEARFDRVLRVAQLPLPEAHATDVDLPRLLEIRESDECRAMRAWLRTTDALTDAELHDSVGQVAGKLSRLFHGTIGKAARVAVGTGLGFIPDVGIPASLGYSVLDMFLLEHVVPQPGPYSWLSHEYPSVFTGS